MSNIQDPSKDPYGNMKKHEATRPKQQDIVSGIFPGQKASDGPMLVNQSGSIIETPSKRERRELRDLQRRQKGAQYKFHIKTFSQYCEDGYVRMMFQIINENVETKRKTVLMEFGYDSGQLQNFIESIEEHNAEIQKTELEAESPTETPES